MMITMITDERNYETDMILLYIIMKIIPTARISTLNLTTESSDKNVTNTVFEYGMLS